ncbi:DUF1963 domain-containing protein [Nocardioides sp.]|uniref:DUF1963 domain-containing protein n=1 Tax=Nocardioides sp. TaxID=35761 RepID=UPI0035B3576D
MGTDLLQFAVTAAGFAALAVALRRFAGQGRAAASLARSDIETAAPLTGTAGAPPAPPAATRFALDAVGGQAVLLQRHVPPRRDGRSYWGGRPTLPAGLAWPSYTDRTGTERALSFLVQVACDEVPEAGRLGLFPDRGTLFVFAEMSWGHDWRWRCLYTADDVSGAAPSVPPTTLPPAYDSRAVWTWAQDDADWPRLLPRWTFTPVLAASPAAPDEVEDPRIWPGRLDVEAALNTIPGAVAEAPTPGPTDHGGPHRPFAAFPHDWRAVLISFGHLARALEQAGRRSGASDEAYARMHQDVAAWTARAREHAPDEPVGAADADEAWDALTQDRLVGLTTLRGAAADAVDATLALHPDPMSVLPPEALRLAGRRHSLASMYDGRRYAHLQQRMLAPPSCPQVEASERVDEWLLLLEVADDPSVGHHLAEGVLQFWIRPEDLAARRFDRVELTAEAY